MENLKALVYGKKLNAYQRALAQREFEKMEKQINDLKLNNIGEKLKSVYLIQGKDSLISYGCFDSLEKAEKYIKDANDFLFINKCNIA